MKNENEKNEVVLVNPRITEFELFVKDKTNLVVTRENAKEMNEVRLEIYRKRIAFQNEIKELSEKAIKILKAPEDDLAAKLKKIADEEQAEKDAELKRIATHKTIIQAVNDRVLKVATLENVLDVRILEGKFAEWKKTHNAEEFVLEFDTACTLLEKAIKDRVEFLEFKAKAAVEERKEDSAIENLIKDSGAAPSNITPEDRQRAWSGNKDIQPAPEVTAPVKDDGHFKETWNNPAIHQNPVPVFGQKEHEAATDNDELLSKAKAGDFSLSVAVNFEYSVHRFHIAPSLPQEAQEAVKKAIIDIIGNLEF